MDFEDEESQLKMYMMAEVEKIARQARQQGLCLGLIVGTAIGILGFWLGRVFG